MLPITETAINISNNSSNSNEQLTAIVTTPAETPLSDQPLILIINSGLIVRTGPYRLHVTLARQLAQLRFSCCRVDLSGIGDSDRVRTKQTNDWQPIDDIQRVMDFLVGENIAQSFIIMGICTGADNAHKAMLSDHRVVGAICIDGYSYPTIRYYCNHYLPRLIKWRTWKNAFSRLCERFTPEHTHTTHQAATQALEYRWELPEKKKTKADFVAFIERNAKLLCIYSSDWPYNYTQQLADAFPDLTFAPHISLAYLQDAKHTFPIKADRQRLITTIEQWLQQHFMHKP